MLAREAHARCCKAQALGDGDAQLDALGELRGLFVGHHLEPYFASKLHELRRHLDLPAQPGPPPPQTQPGVAAAAAQPPRGTLRPEPPTAGAAEAPRQRMRLETAALPSGPFLPPPPPPPPPAAPMPIARPPTSYAAPMRQTEDSAAPLASPAADARDEPACSQASECIAPSQVDDFERFKCSICLGLLHAPITTEICRHSFCRDCYFPAIEHYMPTAGARAGGTGEKRCPLCRRCISLEEARDARVDEVLWTAVRRAFPAQSARRQAQAEAAARQQRDGGSSAEPALPLALQRDLTRAEMLRHRPVLEAACPNYFDLLEAELARPGGELVRCRCPARFVALRKTQRDNGRPFHSCPLWRRERTPGEAARGCNMFEYVL